MRITYLFGPIFLLAGACAPAAFPQSAEDITSLRRDIDAVRDGLKVIQNDLDTIKKLLQQQPAAAAAQPQAFKEAIINNAGAPVTGAKNAKVTVVEFSDYQCPFCGRNFQQTYPQIVNEYIKTGKVKYIFRDFPLETIHPFAFKASEAARCGGEQGKYWEMHDKLFANQTALTVNDLQAHAKAVGLDEAKFKACLDGGEQAATIRNELAEGRRVGMSGTPGFYLGLTQPDETTFKATKLIVGAQPYANFKDAIEELLNQAPEKK